jgi:hypothetical protein
VQKKGDKMGVLGAAVSVYAAAYLYRKFGYPETRKKKRYKTYRRGGTRRTVKKK